MKAVDVINKVKDLNELAETLKGVRQSGKTVVHCHGVFDLIHPGHIRHFEAAKREGDVLVVTITQDQFVNKGPGRPVFNQRLRAESVAALQWVDFVAINRWPSAVEAITLLKPSVYVKGGEYAAPENDVTGMIVQEEEAVTAGGGRMHFTNEITFSSTELLNTHFDVYPDDAQAFLKGFRQRYSAGAVIKQLDRLRKLKVLVIGETIIDEYHYCQAMGKSPKELLVTTKYLREEVFAGGVLACANHVAGFCEDVHLVTCLGSKNSHEEFVRTHLKPNVTAQLFHRDDSSTIVKRRYVDHAFLSKMFEVCFLDDSAVPSHIERDLCAYLKSVLGEYDVVLVADYGHGLLGADTIGQLCAGARFLAVNTQTNSANAGYNLITKYPRADFLCIDEPEMRLACHDRVNDLRKLMTRTAAQLHSRRAVVTRGHLGCMSYSAEEGFFEIPVFSSKIVDRVGAGDAYLSVAAPCVASGMPMDLVGFVGNAVGALAVRIVGNRSAVEPVPLYKFITALLK
ncbi:MAG: adenylyltransferase/cytidyltransferase family protein [Nitrospira sp.]|nr:adenylyltransferase/cytidyltransferase family protein [Nitrospira sp.]